MKIVKYTIALLMLFWTNYVLSQTYQLQYPGYTSYYNYKTLIPDSVVYFCQPHKKVADRLAGFHASGDRKNLSKDYEHSGYDIGHNADASDMNGNATDEYNSFDFINTYPQLPNLNRITWLALENYVRKICPCRVKISWSGIDKIIGPDKVVVPLYCIKEIWCRGKYEKYVMPNKDTVNRHSFDYYKTK